MTQARPQIACMLCAMGPACLASLPEPELGSAAHIVLRTRQVEKDETLHAAGTTQSALYAVRSGAFKVCAPLHNGGHNVVDFLIRGDVVGLDCLGEKAATDVVALASSSVCELPLSRIDALCARSASVAAHLRALLSAAIARNLMWRVALTSFSATQKIAMFILDLATRSGNGGQMQLELTLPMRRSDVGRYLGLRDETVSRSLSALQARGLVATSARTVTILKPRALQMMIRTQ